ncbi:hypothetical protein O181_081377 [Austropuccinia psidii MF-1]|uniref:Uncharacterized protein n=1 Tax=Austropuccinia psidii MF-1 TaxID=1389203 RepID=A0A9Q3IIB1_9BASI|nr:hypothetical protein [Austropuccinia psidii MF-1]
MAFLYSLRTIIHAPHPMGHLGPCWPESNVAKRGQVGSTPAFKARWVPNHKWAHIRPILAPNPNNPEMAKRNPVPKFAKKHSLATFNDQRPPAQSQKDLPSIQGKNFPSLMDPVPKNPGVVHIWYNIPLCTIFAQQSNSDLFRTQICHSNSTPQIHHPF